MAQSVKRKKALQHARGIIKRLSKAGYSVNTDYVENLSNMSTRALQNVTRKRLVQKGLAKYFGSHRTTVVKGKKSKKYYATVDGKRREFTQTTLSEVKAVDIQWDMIKKVVREFQEYNLRDVEEFGGSIDAKAQVSANATEVMDVLLAAEKQYDKDVLIDGIKRVFGSINGFGKELEEFILLVYGKYASDEAETIRNNFDRKLHEALGV